MNDLETLKKVQIAYQEKFASLLKIQEELAVSGIEATDSPVYIQAKEEWIKAGNDLKTHLENPI